MLNLPYPTQSGTHGHCKVKLKRDWEITKDKIARCIIQIFHHLTALSESLSFSPFTKLQFILHLPYHPFFLTQNSPNDASFRKIIPTASYLSQSQPSWFLCSANQNSWKQTWNVSLGSYSRESIPLSMKPGWKCNCACTVGLVLWAFTRDHFHHWSQADKGTWGQRNRRKAHSVYCSRLISVGVIVCSSWVSFFKSLQFLAFSSIRYYSTTMLPNVYRYVDRCINKYIRLLRWVKYIPINCCNSFLVLIKVAVPEVTKRKRL